MPREAALIVEMALWSKPETGAVFDSVCRNFTLRDCLSIRQIQN
jgi:hypothetical protein